MDDPSDKTSSREQLDALQERIVAEHRDNPHPEINPGALKLHLLVHGMVERQLLYDDPPETRQAFEHLLAGGLDRHSAIHAIGEVVAGEVWAIANEKRPFDRQAFVTGLRRLMED